MSRPRGWGSIRWVVAASVAMLGVLSTSTPASAGVIFNFSNSQVGGGSRWDAAPRVIVGVGERSLDGGLRYAMQGRTYEAYRDLFAWSILPSVADFTAAIQQAFNAWSSVDPVSGLGTTVTFVNDPNTAVLGFNNGNGGLNVGGAEIDLFGSTDAGFWNPGNSGTQGETRFGAIGSTVTLTSGTANYAGSSAISGADIIMNSNPQAVYSLDVFRRILTHEIGHAIGLGDVEGDINPGAFIDDNFNGASSATALATLNNSWAGLVNPLNPAASALQRYTVPFANPGTTTPGVDILMESRGVGIGASNPLSNLVPLTNDDYGTRQFLYPTLLAQSVPEPASLTAMVLGVASACGLSLRRRRAAG